ncbi:MAG: hypothetical protein ACREE2_17945 [Stellaceae bacterium]
MQVKEIAEQHADPEQAVAADNRDLFEMANLYPETTGLPMTVWVSPRGNARHDVRVNVNIAHGEQMNIADTAVVGVRPTPRLLAGRLSRADIRAVFEWVALNENPLVEYWEGRIDTARLIRALQTWPPDREPGAPAAP